MAKEETIMTGLGRYFAASILSMLLIGPAVAQTTSSPSSSRPPVTTNPATPKPATTSQSPGPAGSQQQGGLVDINSASAAELDKLPGVGPVRAKAIIANRPYNGKDDLLQRKIIPSNVYSQVKDKIIARQGSTKQ
jgi:competence protein ComEA